MFVARRIECVVAGIEVASGGGRDAAWAGERSGPIGIASHRARSPVKPVGLAAAPV